MNALEFILKLTDRFTPAMTHATAIAGTEASKIKAQFDKIGTGGKQMAASVDELRSRLNAINSVKFGTTSAAQFHHAEAAAKQLEKEIDKIIGKEKHIGEGGGGGGFLKTAFAMAGGNMITGALSHAGEFIKEGMEKAHTRELLNVKIGANLKSAGGQSGIQQEELDKWSSSLGAKIHASKNEIMDMQSQLLTFPAITKPVFERSMGLIADIAKQTGHGLNETSIMFGKAFSSPAEGLQKMQRYGVILTDQEKARITKLQESGNLIGAQKSMLDAIAHSGYAGVAEAMFKADKAAQFSKVMGKLQVQIGGFALAMKEHLMDAFMAVANAIKNVVHWVSEHRVGLILLGITIAALTIGYKAHIAIQKLAVFWQIENRASILLSTAAAKVKVFWDNMMTGASAKLMWQMIKTNLAFLANPVFIVVAGIIVLVAAIIGCVRYVKGWGEAWDHTVKFMKGVFSIFVETTKLMWLNFADGFMSGLELIEKGWYKLKSLWDAEGAAAGLAKINDTQAARAAEIAKQKGVVGEAIVNTLKEGKAVLNSFSIDHGALARDKAGLKNAFGLGKHHEGGANPLNANGEGMPGGETADGDGKAAKDKADKINATGQKSVIITIGKQIEKLEIHVMNGMEAAQAIEDNVREAMRRVMYSLNGVTQ